MYKLFFIAKNNMKKQKGDMITFFLLTFIAAFLIFDCASAIAGVGKMLDDRFDKVNGAHVLLFTGDSEEEEDSAKKAFENDHITDYESTSILQSSCDFKNKNDKEYSQFDFFFESFDDEPVYMNMGIDQSNLKDNDIYIPYFLKNKFDIGDTLQIKIDKDIYDFNVAGYAETPYFTSSINLTKYYVYISDKMMEELGDNHKYSVKKSLYHKGLCDESELSLDFTTKDIENEVAEEYKNLITPYAEEHPENNYLDYLAVNWQMMRGGSQFMPMILMAIILLFAILIMIIAIVIISFSIKNFIQRNMKNTGILEASGYTVKELRGALTVQILLVAALGSIFGIILSIITFKSFADIASIVIGLSWNQPVNIPVMILTFVGIILIVFLVSRSVSRVYKKVSVLDALRGGINTHNFRKNLFSFEKTPLPISIVLSLKDTFGGIGKNLVIVFITMILTISALIGFGMYENFGRDAENLVEFMGFEVGTASVAGDTELGDDLREIDGVENVLGFITIQPTVYFNDEKSTIHTFVYDDMKNGLKTRVVEGRVPEKDNEVMVTNGVADDLGASLGDVIEIEIGDKKEEYIVVGINQRMEMMGRTMLLTEDGAERIIPEITTRGYYVTAKDGVSYETIESRIEDYAKDNDIDFDSMNCSDLGKNMESIIETISISLKLLCIVIAILTAVIVVFVEALIIRAKITREWRGMGISKALGMTSSGLISQIILSNAPAIITGILIGILLSGPAGSKLCLTIFNLFGMRSIDFNIPFTWIAITAVGIFASAVVTSGILGLKVKTLKPVEMITEE